MRKNHKIVILSASEGSGPIDKFKLDKGSGQDSSPHSGSE